MRVLLAAFWCIVASFCVGGAAMAEDGRWRFDFGPGPAAPGYERVAAESTFDASRGFGFELGAILEGVERNARPLRGDFLTSAAPFLFSIAAPEGDYRVTITFGDFAGISDTTVRAETRRLMIERVETRRGAFAVRSFTVNVRNDSLPPPALNAPGWSAVRLNHFDALTRTWDDKLTLEFSGPAPKIAAIEVERVATPRIFLLGDSTVTDQSTLPYASWGQMLPRFFGPDIAIANHAQSGETLKSFIMGLRFEKALTQMRPGDWVFIQFGHNDQKADWPQTYADAATTYPAYLRAYIAEIRRRGGRPVLIASMQRRNFDADGRVVNTLGDYPDAVRVVARAQGVPLIDLSAMSVALYEALGPERSRFAFAQNGADATHHSEYGAYELARCIVEVLRTMPGLAIYLAPDTLPFDPAHPDMPESFVLR